MIEAGTTAVQIEVIGTIVRSRLSPLGENFYCPQAYY